MLFSRHIIKFSIFLGLLLIIIFCISHWNNVLEPYVDNSGAYYTCTVTLNNVNPIFVKNYEQLDGSKVKCFNKLNSGFCVDSLLKIKVNPSPTDSNGSPDMKSRQSVIIENSKGSTNPNVPDIDPWNLPNFFCV